MSRRKWPTCRLNCPPRCPGSLEGGRGDCRRPLRAPTSPSAISCTCRACRRSPFFERAQFPWLAEIEARTDVIRAELTAALAAEQEKFSPYIAYRPGDPVNQWQELNHAWGWSAYHLWRGGYCARQRTWARCPQTAACAGQRTDGGDRRPLPQCHVLGAGATYHLIPPHNGETNARVVAHLPLIVPEGCLYRVGAEQRRWTVGEILVFDDTIEHEARNDSDELRVVLIFDLWNPLLSACRARHGAGDHHRDPRIFRGPVRVAAQFPAPPVNLKKRASKRYRTQFSARIPRDGSAAGHPRCRCWPAAPRRSRAMSGELVTPPACRYFSTVSARRADSCCVCTGRSRGCRCVRRLRC